MRGAGIVLFGVPVRFHFTFVLLIAFVAVGAFGGERTVLAEVLFLFGLFASVLLHELAHALVGRVYGVKTIEIVLYPIGGVARLEKQPEPRPELAIALAGPAMNLLIAAGIFLALGGPGDLVKTGKAANPFARLGLWNVYLAMFNLIPALPMDGGRALRALLAMWKGEAAATRIAASLGKLLAVIMGIYGLIQGEMFLMLIGLLIYMSAAHEGAASIGKELTQGVPVRSAMITDYRTLEHGATLREAADLLLATSQQDFPVLHGGQVIGLLDRTAFLRGMASEGPDSYVAGAMDREFLRLDPAMDLAEAMSSIADSGSCGLVMQDGSLLGLLTTENISEFLMLRQLGIQPKT